MAFCQRQVCTQPWKGDYNEKKGLTKKPTKPKADPHFQAY